MPSVLLPGVKRLLLFCSAVLAVCPTGGLTVAAWALNVSARLALIDSNTARLVCRKEKTLMMLLINVITSDGSRLTLSDTLNR